MPYGYEYAQKMAKAADMRSTIIVVSIINAVWTLLWGIDTLDDVNDYKEDNQPKLHTFGIVLGALYLGASGIELFGLVAAGFHRKNLARINAYLSILGAAAVVGAGFIRVITHFTLKGDLIEECVKVVSGDGVTFRFGIWGPRVHETLNASEANDFCNSAWSHDSASEIISLIIELILSFFFVLIAFAYFKQMKEVKKAKKHQNHTGGGHDFDAQAQGYPSTYNPPYLAYNAPPPPVGGFAPPPGPPPPPVAPYDPHGSKSRGIDSDSDSDPFEDFEAAKKQQNH